MKPITISLSPNVQADDLKIAWQTLLTPWRWSRHISLLPDMEKQLAARLNHKFATLTSSGRTAIFYALEAHGIGEGDEVIIQAFTCLAVPSAVKWAGATPVYADIKPQTYNLDPNSVLNRITPNTKALIVQHTFGIPAPIEELKQMAQHHNLFLIEDLAHALGGTYHNQPLGSFADTTILSFGRDKTISCVYGGAVLTSDRKISDRLKQQQTELRRPPYWWSKQQLLHPILMTLIVPTYFMGGLGKAILVIAQKLRLLSKAVSQREKNGGQPNFIRWRISPALLPLLANQLKKLDAFTKHRQQITSQYLKAVPNDHLKQHLESANWLRFPVRVSHNKSVLKNARAHQLLLGDWYTSPVSPLSLAEKKITGYQSGSCPIAEKAAREVINLPTHINITQQDVDRIVIAVRNDSNF